MPNTYDEFGMLHLLPRCYSCLKLMNKTEGKKGWTVIKIKYPEYHVIGQRSEDGAPITNVEYFCPACVEIYKIRVEFYNIEFRQLRGEVGR